MDMIRWIVFRYGIPIRMKICFLSSVLITISVVVVICLIGWLNGYEQIYRAVFLGSLKQQVLDSIPLRNPKEIVELPILMTPGVSCGKEQDIVVIVVNRVESSDRRDLVRQTWGRMLKRNHSVSVIFAVGKPVMASNEEEIAMIRESQIYEDILLGDFVDTYNNLTLKHLVILQWASRCPGPRLFYTVDDDFIVLPQNLMNFVASAKLATSLIFGDCLIYGGKVERNPVDKNFMPWQTYPYENYPPYCRGSGRIYTADVAQKLLEVVPSISWLRRFGQVEDVAYLGILRLKTNVDIYNINPRISRYWAKSKCAPHSMQSRCITDGLIQIGEFKTHHNMRQTIKKLQMDGLGDPGMQLR